jgi:hypothetical protein
VVVYAPCSECECDTGSCHVVGHWLTLRQPSPPNTKPTFWHSKSNVSTASSNHRSLLSENEPFSISRESFDSYRRSFVCSRFYDSMRYPANITGHLRTVTHPRQCPRDVPPPIARRAPLRRHQALSRCPPLARHAALLNATAPPLNLKPRPGTTRGGVRRSRIERRAETPAEEAQHLLAVWR